MTKLGAMSEITCPSCGTVSHFEQLRRDASEFCRVCDYPLFWARSAAVGEGAGGLDGGSLRRLPGTAGRMLAAAVDCPSCTESNVVTAAVCIRCGADMHPAPPPPPPPPPPTEPLPVVVPPKSRPWELILLIASLVIITIAVIALVVRG